MATVKLTYSSEAKRSRIVRLIKSKIPAACYTMKLQKVPVDFVLTNYLIILESDNLQALLKMRQLHLSDNPESVKPLKSGCKAYSPRNNKSKSNMPTKKATTKKATPKKAVKKVATKKAAPKKKVVKKTPPAAAKRIVALKKELAQDRKKIGTLTRKLKTKTKKLSKIRRTSKQTRRKRK